jgi:hypothetical protein
MIILEEIQGFCKQVGAPEPVMGEDMLVRIFFENTGEFFIDASMQEYVYVYLLSHRPRLTPQLCLHTLQFCDPSRLIGVPMNFIAEKQTKQMGFLIAIPINEFRTATLMIAFNQVLQSLLKLVKS